MGANRPNGCHCWLVRLVQECNWAVANVTAERPGGYNHAMTQEAYQTPPHVAPERTASRTPLVGLSIAGLVFLVSLFNDTLQTEQKNGFLLGLVCLLFGWGAHLSWFANPLLFLSGILLLVRRPAAAACFAAVALPLMLTALQIQETWVNEAGTKGPVSSYGLGFYLWIATAVTLLVTAIIAIAAPRLSSRPAV
jgi:hypothetical protein